MPEFLIESGRPWMIQDTPDRRNGLLEALMAPLSCAIKDLQNRPNPSGPGVQKALEYCRSIEKKLKEANGRALSQNTVEVVKDAFLNIRKILEKLEKLDHVHPYHNLMIGVPYHDSSHPGPMQYFNAFQATWCFSLRLSLPTCRRERVPARRAASPNSPQKIAEASLGRFPRG